jgi:uncharacterized phage protein gp47/JayE
MAFDYASRDYDTIKTDLLARASRVLPEWTDRDPSDFGMLLIDLWAYAADVMHFYIDRAANEQYLITATQRESLLATANLFDYIPKSRSSATATLTLSNTNSSIHIVAPYTQFIARYDNKTYQVYTRYGGSVDGGTQGAPGFGTIDITEGTVVLNETLTAGSNGRPGQRYLLSNRGTVSSSIVVTVFENPDVGTVYRRVDRVATARTGDRVYAVNVTADGDTEIVFGNNVSGFAPPSNARIVATYAYSSGALGNLPANSVVGFRTATPTGVSVVSNTAFSGGADEESITSLRTSIPSIISSQNRAVTARDFINLSLQVEGIAKAAVSYEPSPLGGSSAGNASVTVYAHPTLSDQEFIPSTDAAASISSITVPTATRDAVTEFLQSRALLGVTVDCASTINWELIDIAVDVYVNDRSVRAWVERDVKSAIDQLFSFDNVFFGQRLTIGQLYRAVLAVNGVNYAIVTAFHKDSDLSPSVQNEILIDSLRIPRRKTVTLNMQGGVTSS